MPAPSEWGTILENCRSPLAPALVLTSDGFTPEVLTEINTSFEPGDGSGSSPTFSTSAASPVFSYHAAFISSFYH